MSRQAISTVLLALLTLVIGCSDDTTASDTGPADTSTMDSAMMDSGAMDSAPTDSGGACDPPTDGGAPGLSFTDSVYPIIETRCAPCHTASSSGGLGMLDAESAWCNLVGAESVGNPGATRVVAGDFAASYLIEKITEDMPTAGLRMPRNGPPYLEDTDIMTIRTWIDDGALF